MLAFEMQEFRKDPFDGNSLWVQSFAGVTTECEKLAEQQENKVFAEL